MITHPFQLSLRTSRPPEEVLEEMATRPLPGIDVSERGAHHLVLQPRSTRRYGSDLAVAAAVVIVLAVLIATAFTPVFIVLLPLAVLPAVPLLLDHRPDLAVSAITEEEGATRVTVHGEATTEVAAAVDEFLEALPEPTTEPEEVGAVAARA